MYAKLDQYYNLILWSSTLHIWYWFQVIDGAFMALMPKQTSQSIVNLSLTSDKSGTTKPWDYQRLGEYMRTFYQQLPYLLI